MPLYGADVRLVYAEEGGSNLVYQDAGGVWPICYGHARGVKPGDKKTDEECIQLLIEDMAIS